MEGKHRNNWRNLCGIKMKKKTVNMCLKFTFCFLKIWFAEWLKWEFFIFRTVKIIWKKSILFNKTMWKTGEVNILNSDYWFSIFVYYYNIVSLALPFLNVDRRWYACDGPAARSCNEIAYYKAPCIGRRQSFIRVRLHFIN